MDNGIVQFSITNQLKTKNEIETVYSTNVKRIS